MYDVVNAAGVICFSVEELWQAEALVTELNAREDES